MRKQASLNTDVCFYRWEAPSIFAGSSSSSRKKRIFFEDPKKFDRHIAERTSGAWKSRSCDRARERAIFLNNFLSFLRNKRYLVFTETPIKVFNKFLSVFSLEATLHAKWWNVFYPKVLCHQSCILFLIVNGWLWVHTKVTTKINRNCD